MIHVKDFLPPANTTAPGDQGAQRFGRELGRGSIDYRPIFAAAKAAGGRGRARIARRVAAGAVFR